MKKLIIILIILAITIISFLIYSNFKAPNETISGSTISKTTKESEQNSEQNADSFDTNSRSSTSSDGGDDSESDASASGGATGSTGTGETTIPPECSTEQISYSLYKISKISTCLNYQNEICIEKTAACSVTVQNLDYVISGEFQIDFILKDTLTEQIIQQETLQATIGPRKEQTLKKTFQVASPDAGKELTCDIFTKKVPTKTVC